MNVFNKSVLAVALTLALTSCGKKPPEKPQITEELSAAEKAAQQQKDEHQEEDAKAADIPLYLDAVVRAHSGATMVCYDSTQDAFLIHYPDLPKGAPDDNHFHGWYLLRVPDKDWYQSANDTYYIRDYPDSDYAEVYPDTKNLPCKPI